MEICKCWSLKEDEISFFITKEQLQSNDMHDKYDYMTIF